MQSLGSYEGLKEDSTVDVVLCVWGDGGAGVQNIYY